MPFKENNLFRLRLVYAAIDATQVDKSDVFKEAINLEFFDDPQGKLVRTIAIAENISRTRRSLCCYLTLRRYIAKERSVR